MGRGRGESIWESSLSFSALTSTSHHLLFSSLYNCFFVRRGSQSPPPSLPLPSPSMATLSLVFSSLIWPRPLDLHFSQSVSPILVFCFSGRYVNDKKTLTGFFSNQLFRAKTKIFYLSVFRCYFTWFVVFINPVMALL